MAISKLTGKKIKTTPKANTSAKIKVPKVKPLDNFTWVGVNRKGKKINGELTAKNILELKTQLRKQGITPKKVKAVNAIR